MPNEKLFFSYSRLDSEIALKLATDLRNAGANLWLDQLDIPVGETWDLEIEKALQGSNCLIFIASHASVISDNALNEVYFALEEKKRVVPVRINDCKLPFRIQRLQYIDLSINYDAGFNHLLKTLTLERKPEPVNENQEAKNEPVNLIQNIHIKEEDQLKQDLQSRNHEMGIGMDRTPLQTSTLANSDSNLQGDTKNQGGAKKRPIRIFIIGGAVLLILIILYLLSSNPEPDPAEPVTESAVSSAAVNIDSLNAAGESFYNNKEYDKALEAFTPAANAGSAVAMFYMGYLYHTGLGVTQDYNKAMDWYIKAADGKSADAMYNIGLLYESGLGVPIDLQTANEWFKKAADAGYKK